MEEKKSSQPLQEEEATSRSGRTTRERRRQCRIRTCRRSWVRRGRRCLRLPGCAASLFRSSVYTGMSLPVGRSAALDQEVTALGHGRGGPQAPGAWTAAPSWAIASQEAELPWGPRGSAPVSRGEQTGPKVPSAAGKTRLSLHASPPSSDPGEPPECSHARPLSRGAAVTPSAGPLESLCSPFLQLAQNTAKERRCKRRLGPTCCWGRQPQIQGPRSRGPAGWRLEQETRGPHCFPVLGPRHKHLDLRPRVPAGIKRDGVGWAVAQ